MEQKKARFHMPGFTVNAKFNLVFLNMYRNMRQFFYEEAEIAPEPTDAPVPTEKPEPTDAPIPTEKPESTDAPIPTLTPEPTVTSEEKAL